MHVSAVRELSKTPWYTPITRRLKERAKQKEKKAAALSWDEK